MNKDRDLVVGQLALQADLITPNQLTLATEALSAEKTVSMGEVLESRGFVDSSCRAELERLAEQEIVEEDDPAMSTLAAISKRSQGPPEQPTIATPAGDGPVGTVATNFVGAETLETERLADPESPTVGFMPSSTSHVRLSSLGEIGSGEIRNRYARTHLHARGGSGRSGSPGTATSAARSPSRS